MKTAISIPGLFYIDTRPIPTFVPIHSFKRWFILFSMSKTILELLFGSILPYDGGETVLSAAKSNVYLTSLLKMMVLKLIFLHKFRRVHQQWNKHKESKLHWLAKEVSEKPHF
jgi:hypothetical protein